MKRHFGQTIRDKWVPIAWKCKILTWCMHIQLHNCSLSYNVKFQQNVINFLSFRNTQTVVRKIRCIPVTSTWREQSNDLPLSPTALRLETPGGRINPLLCRSALWEMLCRCGVKQPPGHYHMTQLWPLLVIFYEMTLTLDRLCHDWNDIYIHIYVHSSCHASVTRCFDPVWSHWILFGSSDIQNANKINFDIWSDCLVTIDHKLKV